MNVNQINGEYGEQRKGQIAIYWKHVVYCIAGMLKVFNKIFAISNC